MKTMKPPEYKSYIDVTKPPYSADNTGKVFTLFSWLPVKSRERYFTPYTVIEKLFPTPRIPDRNPYSYI